MGFTARFLASLVLGAGACALDPVPPPPPPPFTCSDDDGSSALFVVSVLQLPLEMPDGTVLGVDLDGIDTPAEEVSDPRAFAAGCGQPDTVSAGPDADTGVDNQLSAIFATLRGEGVDPDALLAERIRTGEQLILVGVESVDDASNDPCIHVSVHAGRRRLADPVTSCTDDAMCAGDGTEVCALRCEMLPAVDAEGILASNQIFDGAPLATADGSIVRGRVRANPLEMIVSVPILGVWFELLLREVQLRMTFARTGVADGVIGGEVGVDELSAAVHSSPELTAMSGTLLSWPHLLESVFRNLADLDPSVAGDCQSISIGLAFDGVPAIRGETR